MNKFTPYSVSKIQTYLQCPKRFEFCYIIKQPIVQSFYHLEKGLLWHSLIEHKLSNTINNFNKPNFKELSQKQYLFELSNCIKFIKSEFFNKYLNSQYNQITEQYFCIDNNFNCYFDKSKKDILFRGYIDLIQYNNIYAEVIDWKTGGKSLTKIKKYPKDNFQLDVYAYVINSICNIDNIIGKYVFVEHKYEQTKQSFNFSNIKEYIIEIINKIENIEKFERKESILCDWCDYRGWCLT